ncbi:MAG: hypothetical protein WA828_07715 [Coleofasciculaceae cyanobacterium]
MSNQFNKIQVATYADVSENGTVWNIKAAAISLAFLTMLLSACTTNNTADPTVQTNVSPTVGATTAQTNVSTEEVANKTNALIGKSVTVRSEVDKKVGANSFTIGDDKLFGSEKILVINASGAPTVLPDDVKLQVTGKVAKLVVAEFEKEYNLKLEPVIEAEYKDRPVIIAQSIALSPEVGEITKNPAAFYGKTIAVKGEVEDIVSATAFRLDEDGLDGVIDNKDLLILNKSPNQAVKNNEVVVVTGVLRPFVVADIERDYDLKWDLTVQKKLEAEYTQKPALIAKQVFPSAKE